MFKKLGDLWSELVAQVTAHFMVYRAKRLVKMYSSVNDHILAGDIIISSNIKDQTFRQIASKLHHRVNRLYYLLSLYNDSSTTPPKIVIDKEIELINKAIGEVEARIEAKSGLHS